MQMSNGKDIDAELRVAVANAIRCVADDVDDDGELRHYSLVFAIAAVENYLGSEYLLPYATSAHKLRNLADFIDCGVGCAVTADEILSALEGVRDHA